MRIIVWLFCAVCWFIIASALLGADVVEVGLLVLIGARYGS